jgi:hypothetical protein
LMLLYRLVWSPVLTGVLAGPPCDARLALSFANRRPLGSSVRSGTT